jgi:hypothetical protein
MPNFQEAGSLGELVKYKDAKKGDILIEYGEFTGTNENQFGKLFNFIEKDKKKKSLVACGKLKWMLENNELIEGACYQITYTGTSILEKGPYKGKEFHTLEVLVDRDSLTQVQPKADGTSENNSDLGILD